MSVGWAWSIGKLLHHRPQNSSIAGPGGETALRSGEMTFDDRSGGCPAIAFVNGLSSLLAHMAGQDG